MKLRNERHDKEQASPISPEQLKQMLEKSVEISIADMAEADLTQSSELFLTNLIKELEQQAERQVAEAPARPPQGRPTRHRHQHFRRRARAPQRAQVLLLRRVGLPRRRLPPPLVPHR